MKTLYLDCNMGATGEMLASALLAIHPNQNQVIERLNQLNLPGIRFQAESVATGGHREGAGAVSCHPELSGR